MVNAAHAIAWGILFTAFGQLAWGKQDVMPPEESLLKSAATAYHDGRFVEAGERYSRLNKLDPGNIAVLERLGAISLWKNRPQEAEGYLQEAISRARGLQKFWPFNAEHKARLGMAYYRADRFAEAAQLFRDSAGPVAIGPFRDLAALGSWLASFGGERPYVIEGPSETRLDFIVTDPLPVVKVSINDGSPVHFLIDTGGSELILDNQFAKAVGARLSATMVGEFGGSKKAALGLGKVDSIKLGSHVVTNVPVHTLDLSSMPPLFSGLDIKGILGTRILMHFLATIDYPDAALILRRDTPENRATLRKQADAEKMRRIPFWLIDTHYIVALGTVNGLRPMLFVVDTGLAGQGFIPANSILREAGIAVDWSKAEEGVGGGGKFKTVPIVVDELTLGTGSEQVVVRNVPGSVQEHPPLLGDQFGFEIRGLLSHQFFRRHALTLDFTNMRMLIE